MNSSSPFKWRHYQSEIILRCVRWYLSYPLSYRQVVEMVNERGLDIHHTSVFRWVQEYSPEIDKRFRPHLRLNNDSWRVDETYILVKGKWKYLYRAVGSAGNTLDFLLTAKRDAKAAKRFFRKMLKAIHTSVPRVITVDKNPAYPKAISLLKAAKKLPEIVKLRQIKYLNNIVEQDHRGIKRLVKPGMGFGSFNTARRTIRGYEIMNMMRKGQVVGVPRGAIKERLVFIHQIFGLVA
ncbi:IS6 family transposase [Synechocystis sp. PCC 7509]|uniref:IS6 family transposase n=1 Tax=Synechocystis sp. PCC 7509 TaxID=927677 RepID=UPI0002AD1235|nr:IS6 family transposase [Synechocystis sp. PCC 7509]